MKYVERAFWAVGTVMWLLNIPTAWNGHLAPLKQVATCLAAAGWLAYQAIRGSK